MTKVRIKNSAGGMAAGAAAGFAPLTKTETEAPSEYAEIRGYSITPTTLEWREYETDLSNALYTETYSYGAHTVCRIGINIGAVTKAPEPGVWQAAGGATSAAGSIKSTSTKYSEAEIKQVRHHTIEKEALVTAVSHLLASTANVIILDTLERDKGAVKQQLVTHAVVLYKNPTNAAGSAQEIIVLDPSNFMFSSHLASTDMRDTLQAAGVAAVIKTFHKPLQIYKAETATGPAAHEYRDCIDIAVKLCFALLASSYTGQISTHDEVKALEAVQYISNNESINSFILNIASPSRLKQNSDMNVVQEYTRIEKEVTQRLVLADRACAHLQSRIKLYSILEQDASNFGNQPLAGDITAVYNTKTAKIKHYKDVFDKLSTCRTTAESKFSAVSDVSHFNELTDLELTMAGELRTLLSDID